MVDTVVVTAGRPRSTRIGASLLPWIEDIDSPPGRKFDLRLFSGQNFFLNCWNFANVSVNRIYLGVL
jgi:hypothetical protein